MSSSFIHTVPCDQISLFLVFKAEQYSILHTRVRMHTHMQTFSSSIHILEGFKQGYNIIWSVFRTITGVGGGGSGSVVLE